MAEIDATSVTGRNMSHLKERVFESMDEVVDSCLEERGGEHGTAWLMV